MNNYFFRNKRLRDPNAYYMGLQSSVRETANRLSLTQILSPFGGLSENFSLVTLRVPQGKLNLRMFAFSLTSHSSPVTILFHQSQTHKTP